MLLNAPRELSEPVRAGVAPGHRAGMPIGARERARLRLVWVVMVIYLLAIFEGSIRKFVVPQFGQYVFFIRDPLLLYAYVVASRFGLWPRQSLLFDLSVFMCGFGVCLFAMQVAVGGLDATRALLGVYGWRNYFLYVPLAFLVGAQVRAADLARFAKVTLWLAVPIAVLVSLQFFSAKDASINVGVAEEKELQFEAFGLNAERIRPSGPFTSNVGQQQFVVTALVFLLAMLLVPASQRAVSVVVLIVAAGAILTCIGLSGSRGTVLQSVLTGLFALALGVVGRGAGLKGRALVLPLMLGAAAVSLYPIVLPEGFAAFTDRWTAAAAASTSAGQGSDGGVALRTWLGFTDFLRLVDAVPTLGYGLGYGGNASLILRATVDGVMPGFLAEADFSRHMVDLGAVFGLCYIAFRFAVVAWLARQAWTATRRTSRAMPMLLFSYAGYVVLQSQITGHGSVNVYGWLFAGLCIAASRDALESVVQKRTVRPFWHGRLRPSTSLGIKFK